jgi:hypothetical protein
VTWRTLAGSLAPSHRAGASLDLRGALVPKRQRRGHRGRAPRKTSGSWRAMPRSAQKSCLTRLVVFVTTRGACKQLRRGNGRTGGRATRVARGTSACGRRSAPVRPRGWMLLLSTTRLSAFRP